MLDVAITRRVDGFTLDVALTAGSGVTAVFGPSGAGKTSLARCVAGLERPDAGRIVLDGQEVFGPNAWVPVHKRAIGYVFQEARLFPHLTVERNLLYGAPTGTAPGQVADMLGIKPLLGRRTAGLSGGEAARVAIGRALLRQPRLLIMDEPLAALDARRRGLILPYLERLRDHGIPILYISHAIEEVARLASTLVLMRAGQVVRSGPVEEMLSDPTVAADIGPSQAGAVLSGIIRKIADGLAEVETPAGCLHLAGVEGGVGTALRLRIRAEDVIVATQEPVGLSALNVLPMVVEQVLQGQGPGVMVRLRAGDGALLARVTRVSADRLGLVVGRPVWAVIKTTGVARLDVGGGGLRSI
ncbi:molybdenum import ATP-binding protein ModC [Jannaschia pagri]|uniref:Molybdenum import ATP-binding protein ModC n=1 Tax=Jannaschia pagri TaxID=2829797 RepID=A0ABQ4NPJ3_9RHOB|nr:MULTISPECIES: molybdenum ABC transporter ATP-binding protein [unclassified Jannaschia]GIT92314.1 molybdenum import ATP-binding protein ModC [Jannaschia sp. AI_61]GIT96149.1 molybdenum import ATP-binding protein ModC [Jannaschia sp. AI_62]